MKAFSFMGKDDSTQIGVVYQEKHYNFSEAWETYKYLKNQGKGPELVFLQVMVEADFFQLDSFEEVLLALTEAGALASLMLSGPIKFLPPIGRPQKILCVGRNYTEHAEELGNTLPKEPLFFSKSPSALIGQDDVIRLPKSARRVDHEGELAIVIGRQASNVDEARAMEHVAGFSLLNDITARDIQRKDAEAGLPWFRSKSFDTFCPLGPFLVPRQVIHNYKELELLVRVNGRLKQKASLSQLIFDLPQIVAYISRFCTLEPGDIIATGTPAGVGPIAKADTVEVEVGEIGCLRNTVA